MTDDLRPAEQALRDVLAARAADVPPPAGVYATVRRRHVRRRATLAAAVAATLVAGGVTTALAATRTERALPAAGSSCGTGTTPPVDPDLTFPPQTDVRGSLGEDAALIQAVLRTGWAAMQRPGPYQRGQTLYLRTARVLYAERVGGMIVAGMTASDGAWQHAVGPGGDALQVYVVGRDRDSLTGYQAGGWTKRQRLSDGPYYEGVLTDSEPITGVTVCGDRYAILLTRAGATASLRWVSEVRPDGSVVSESVPVLLYDGFAVVRIPGGIADATVEIPGGPRTTRRVRTYPADPYPFTDAEAEAAVRAAGGTDPALARQVRVAAAVAGEDVTQGLPPSDLRVLGLPRAGGRGALLISWAVPGGCRIVVSSPVPLDQARWGAGNYLERLPAAGLDDRVFAWAPVAGDPSLAVVATRGVRAELVGPGGVRTVELRAGAALVPDAGPVTQVRAYDAGGALIGSTPPNPGR